MPRAAVVVFLGAVLLLVACADSDDEEPDPSLAPSLTTAPTPIPTSPGPWIAPEGTPVAHEGWTSTRRLELTYAAPDGYEGPVSSWYGEPVVELRTPSHDATVVINAETGVLVNEAGDDTRTKLKEILDTVRRSPLDPATAPWPYSGTVPEERRGSYGRISFVSPDPLSGISMSAAIADLAGPGSDPEAYCGKFIAVSNWRSGMQVSACDGRPSNVRMDPIDQAAFDAFLATVLLLPEPMPD
jgi:hypothetical protein